MNSPFSVSRNSDRSYYATLPQRPAVLPPTHHRVIAGVEMGRDSVPTDDVLFAGAVRHFNMVARHVSAQAITLTPLASAELEGALHLACGSGGVDIHQDIPSITSGRSFRVVRSADLFDGGTLSALTPGVYTAGDTIVDPAHGRVYLELHHGERATSVAVIGLFKEGRLPVCVDWRVTETAS